VTAEIAIGVSGVFNGILLRNGSTAHWKDLMMCKQT